MYKFGIYVFDLVIKKVQEGIVYIVFREILFINFSF